MGKEEQIIKLKATIELLEAEVKGMMQIQLFLY